MIGKFYTPTTVPDGEYQGRWSGYNIDFEHDGREVKVATSIGVRGINCPCEFQVVDGKIDETTIKAIHRTAPP